MQEENSTVALFTPTCSPEGRLKEEDSELADLRYYAPDWKLNRLAAFLLQGVELLVRTYQPSPEISDLFGFGERTAPRMAMLFLRETFISDMQWKALVSCERRFYGRVTQEATELKVLQEEENTESLSDQKFQVNVHVDTLLQLRLPQALQDGYVRLLRFGPTLVPDDQLYAQLKANELQALSGNSGCMWYGFNFKILCQYKKA